MKRIILLLTLAAVFSAGAFAQTKPVESREPARARSESESDGCSLFPEGNYCDCCVRHDREYFYGGSSKARWRSDKKLFQCVWAKPKFYNKLVAPVMWLGVRAFGGAWLKADFSWGFGKRQKISDRTPKKNKRKKKKDCNSNCRS